MLMKALQVGCTVYDDHHEWRVTGSLSGAMAQMVYLCPYTEGASPHKERRLLGVPADVMGLHKPDGVVWYEARPVSVPDLSGGQPVEVEKHWFGAPIRVQPVRVEGVLPDVQLASEAWLLKNDASAVALVVGSSAAYLGDEIVEIRLREERWGVAQSETGR